jgi:hypothetical protein
MSKVVRALALCILVSPPLAAQVGHDPERSPYHPILLRTSISAMGHYIAGSSGKLGVGPSDGPGVGLRYDMRLTGPTDVFASVAWSGLERMVVDTAAAAADDPISGPVNQSVLFAEAGILILLTGDKTWNRLAPYLGANLGLAFGASVPQDSSGYSFKTKFVSGPLLGLQFYAAGSVFLRVEGRLQFWRLKYPSSYFLAPGDGDSVLDPTVDSESEWTTHPTLLVGLGYAFRF